MSCSTSALSSDHSNLSIIAEEDWGPAMSAAAQQHSSRVAATAAHAPLSRDDVASADAATAWMAPGASSLEKFVQQPIYTNGGPATQPASVQHCLTGTQPQAGNKPAVADAMMASEQTPLLSPSGRWIPPLDSGMLVPSCQVRCTTLLACRHFASHKRQLLLCC